MVNQAEITVQAIKDALNRQDMRVHYQPTIRLQSGKRAALESGLYTFVGQVIVEITERQALTVEGTALLNESRKTGLQIALGDF